MAQPIVESLRIKAAPPTGIYPMSLIWRDDNPHPTLARLRDYLDARRTDAADSDAAGTAVWMPKWDQRSA